MLGITQAIRRLSAGPKPPFVIIPEVKPRAACARLLLANFSYRVWGLRRRATEGMNIFLLQRRSIRAEFPHLGFQCLAVNGSTWLFREILLFRPRRDR